jgi:hypothetical protein
LAFADNFSTRNLQNDSPQHLKSAREDKVIGRCQPESSENLNSHDSFIMPWNSPFTAENLQSWHSPDVTIKASFKNAAELKKHSIES